MAIATTGKTIRPDEAAHFGRLAADWWDPKGSSAMLHRLNPVRLGFIRAAIDAHWPGDSGPDSRADSRSVRPLAGKRALDVGCGAGLLCEPLTRLGAQVTGVDAAAENIAVAQDHAAGSGLGIAYHHGEIGALGLTGFDLVTALEVIEHVADKAAFVAALAGALKPANETGGGLMVISTPNRSAASRLLLVGAAEAIGMVPKGTHHWDDFITPDELRELLAAAGLVMSAPKGIAFSPLTGLGLSDNLALNYIVTARNAEAIWE